MSHLPETLEFDSGNRGRSFDQQYGLLDELGRSAGISVDIYSEDVETNDDGNVVRDLSDERARRVVAAWNAVEKIPTEVLEDCVLRDLIWSSRAVLDLLNKDYKPLVEDRLNPLGHNINRVSEALKKLGF